MPHWIIINGEQVFVDHGLGGRTVPFDDTLPKGDLDDDHMPAKLTIQNVDDEFMGKMVKAAKKALKHE